MLKLIDNKNCIILPLKESFSHKNFGAVSIWVNDYLKFSNLKKITVFCKKLNNSDEYLDKNIIPISVNTKFYTNFNYIKKIDLEIKKNNFKVVEIHNRPEYAFYLFKKNPNLKINLIFHNDPNLIRYSNSIKYKEFLLNKCNKIIFVSKWVQKRFFENISYKHKNNTDVIYNFINPLKKFPKKKKIIIFSGKLNKSKGFNIFGQSIVQILNKHTDWFAEVYGNEQREKFLFKHKNLKIMNWINHKKLLKIYEKSSISVVNPKWEEPFGRTALESASRGCAVITTNSGGLSETFNNNLILKKNTVIELSKLLSRLIENDNFLKKIQKINFKNVIHTPNKSVSKLDLLRIDKINNVYNKANHFKILHISNFGIKTNHRLFNLSIAKKLSNGLIRNGHDVIDFDYRNFGNRFFDQDLLDDKILKICDNYKPDLVLLGHNNILKRQTLLYLKENLKIKIALWYEDHLIKGDPNYLNNITLIEKNNDLIDEYFVTTSPDIIKSDILKKKIHFLPIPVDPNIENGNFFEKKKEKDLFFALSHGVNYGKLKTNANDNRSYFIEELLEHSNNNLSFHFLGLYKEQPKWNFQFNDELMICKTALNLSRGGPSKYCSSNRIATLMGNGILPFIHEKVRYQDFFDNDEIVIYKNSSDLISKLTLIKNDNSKLIKRSRSAKRKYFDLFENTIIADFLIHKIFDIKSKYKYKWQN